MTLIASKLIAITGNRNTKIFWQALMFAFSCKDTPDGGLSINLEDREKLAELYRKE